VGIALGVWAVAAFAAAEAGGPGRPVGQAAWAPELYGLCMETHDARQRSIPQQAQMLRELGFDGAAYPLWLDESLDKNLKTLDAAGLKVYMLYASVNVDPAAPPFDPRLPAAIGKLKGRPATICLLLHGFPPGDPRGEAPAVKILRQLGDLAARSGVRVSIYHHTGDWTASLLYALKIVKMANHPQVGVNFNLCHWLMVDGDKDYRPVLRENARRIFAVTICGAKLGSKTWTNGLIQPLDQGDFDNRALLGTLREAGYRGPIGLMCYGIPGDAAEHLQRSMKVWKTWQSQRAAKAEDKAYVRRTRSQLALGNRFLEIIFDMAGEPCSAIRLVNKLSGRTIPISADSFSLGIEGRGSVRRDNFLGASPSDQPIPGGKRIVVKLSDSFFFRPVSVAITFELRDNDHFLRRRLEMTSNQPLPLRRVEAWIVGLPGKAIHQGFGEPVFLEDTFWGLEFPAAENSYHDGAVHLVQHPGRTIGSFISKTAVLGVSEPGRVAQRFQQYVESFRVTPEKTALFVNYNTWWTLMPPTEKNCLELVDLFRRKLFEPYGESVDTFTLDDGWDDKNSLWAIRGDRFPHGFGPLVKALAGIHARLGIWLSPSSGYSHAPWLSTHGYEGNSNPWFCCQSGPNYRKAIIARVCELARQYQVAFFKFDGFSATCDAPGHGHLPGPYAQEANVDAYIELLGAVRAVRPGIYLDPTCGIWLSPWWLRYADSLWGSVSGDYPDIIVPAPILRDSATTTRDGVFRQRCAEHPGYPPAAIEHLGIIVITPEKWEDNAMIVAGRGCRLLTLYIDPKFFVKGDRDWAFLASLLRWVRHNARTLQQITPILGDPMRREPYGYAHFHRERGILALRNPFVEPRVAEVKLDQSAGWTPPGQQQAPAVPGTFLARVVYPRYEVLGRRLHYGDTLRVPLAAYETAVVEIEPLPADRPELMGVRAEAAECRGGRVTYTVYGRPGQRIAAALAGPFRPTSATQDGRPITPGGEGGQVQIPLVFPGECRSPAVSGGRLDVSTSGGTWQIAGRCQADVPPGAKAKVHLLCDPRSRPTARLCCEARVNGQPAAVQAVLPPANPGPSEAAHTWTWFSFDLPEGHSHFAVTVRPERGTAALARGEIGWWLWTEQPLRKSTVALEFDRPLGNHPPQPLPLPIAMATEREVIAIESCKAFRAGSPWPEVGQKVVYLDEVPAEEVALPLGCLQLNKSWWEKEMIVCGRKFTRGLGTHANSRIAYDLSDGHFQSFRCLVGRDEHAGDGRVVFEVWLDGKRVFNSGPMTRATPPKECRVDVRGARLLELRALDGGDGISGDHADWAEAQLLR
jgi:sugar phosphate isomerase/epimerase